MIVRSDTFASYVRDALAHLYDRPYLRTHPLRPLLLGPTQTSPADELRRLLLDAIAQLRPPDPCPPASPTWRRHRYLVLRYVEGAKPERIARELQISVRQSRREHDRALEAVASLLWERHRHLAGRGEPTPPPPASAPAPAVTLARSDTAEPSAPEAASDELLKIGSLAADEPASVAEVVRDAVAIVSKLAELRGARIQVCLPASLPPVRVHRLVLRQVLIDLLGCAVESRPEASVEVSASDSAREVSLEISAPNAAQRDLPQSPEVDVRLAASRRLIELQAGSLRVVPGAGEAFRVHLGLPLAPIRTLLVVDDNPDVAYLFSRFLRDHGYRVLQASTGQAALQLAREARPDAITLDVLMPSEDGWDILRALASDPGTRSIPTILCSVLPERSLALSLGVAEFLNKPVTQPALLAALHRVVGDG